MEKIFIKKSWKSYKNKPTKEDLFYIAGGMKNCKSKTEVTFNQLATLIKCGYSAILAEYNNEHGIFEENITSLSVLALDVDGKENKITMKEMIELVKNKLNISPIIYYRTFSDVDNTRFRLIYRLERKVTVEEYRKIYKSLQIKFSKYVDGQTINANRIWAGTNKGVCVNEQDSPIKEDLINVMIKYINDREKRANSRKLQIKRRQFDLDFSADYIKPEFKKEAMEFIISNCDIIQYIKKYWGGDFTMRHNNYVGRCVLHGGDNPSALVINGKIFTCFTKCGTGNIFTLAKKNTGITNFSKLVFLLAKEYNLNIPEKFIRRVK